MVPPALAVAGLSAPVVGEVFFVLCAVVCHSPCAALRVRSTAANVRPHKRNMSGLAPRNKLSACVREDVSKQAILVAIYTSVSQSGCCLEFIRDSELEMLVII